MSNEKDRSTSHVTSSDKSRQDKNSVSNTQTNSASGGKEKKRPRSGMGTSASAQSMGTSASAQSMGTSASAQSSANEDIRKPKISQCIFQRLEKDRPKLGDTDRMELFRMVQMEEEAAVLDKLKYRPPSSINIEQPGPYNRRLLHAAAEKNHAKLIRYLIVECGANVDAQDADGWFPEHFAASTGAVNALECLLNSRTKRRNYGIRNWEEQTPLMTAAIFGQAKAAECLLNHGMDVNAVDQDGDTAFILAVKCGHADVAQFLMRNSQTNKKHTNNQGKSAMDYAKGNSAIEKILSTRFT